MQGENIQDTDALDAQKARPIRKRHRVTGEKVCQVCGDKALAHHFGALACETCKAFFRRNALKTEETRKCAFQGRCPVDKKTRRFCPPCRLKKCFDVGMKADFILDDDERRERQQKVNKNRAKLAKVDTDTNVSSTHSSGCVVTTSGFDAPGSFPENFSSFEHPVKSDSCAEIQRPSGACPIQDIVRLQSNSLNGQGAAESMYRFESTVNIGSQFTNNHVNDIAHVSTGSYMHSGVNSATYAETASASFQSPNSIQSQPEQKEAKNPSRPSSTPLAREKMIAAFEHIPRDQLPSDPFMYWRLLEEERCLLTNLSAAYQDTMLSILQRNPPKSYLKSEEITTESYLHECEIEVRHAIDFAKRLEDFKRLRTDEQVALLKASTDQVLAIRSCALYICEKDAWLTMRGYFTREHADIICPDHPHLDIGATYCRVIKDIVKNDFTLYALLHCLVLFDPSDERIIDRQVVNLIRDKYVILLRHYLESVYSYCHSDKYLMALQEKLTFYRHLSREGKPLIKKFFPSIPNQLLVEVLDLD